jgi:hypothetical protein
VKALQGTHTGKDIDKMQHHIIILPLFCHSKVNFDGFDFELERIGREQHVQKGQAAFQL